MDNKSFKMDFPIVTYNPAVIETLTVCEHIH
jgi:hypothetical protein